MTTPSLEYPPLLIGGGYDVMAVTRGEPIRRDEEYIASAVGFRGVRLPQGLSPSFDVLTRQFGTRVYDAMMVDPVVASCFEILKLGILSNGVEVTPTVKSNPGAKEQSPKLALSTEVAESCARMQAAMDTPLENVLWQMLDGLSHANKLAEKVYAPAERGPDKGRLLVRKIKPKPAYAWRFIVDSSGEVIGYQGISIVNADLRVYPVEKFFLFNPLATDGDPRGHSVLRVVYDAWNFKLQTLPEMFAASQQFGSPSVIGITAPGDVTEVLPEDANGQPIEGAQPLSPQAALNQAIVTFIKNGGSLTVPNGTEIKVLDAKYDGKFFKTMLDWITREIAFGLLKSTRMAIEAEHGSKADSGTQQDSTGLVIRFFQGELCRAYRKQVLYPYVALNWGDDVADEHTPEVSLGVTEHQDFATNAGAIAQLWTAGVLKASQRIPACLMLGLDPGDPAADDADEAKQQEAANQAADAGPKEKAKADGKSV